MIAEPTYNVNRRAVLEMIATSEGTQRHALTRNQGYDVIVTGIDLPRREVFLDYSRHPFAPFKPGTPGRPAKRINNNGLCSTASGRYQIILPSWKEPQTRLGLPNFAPVWQDAWVFDAFRQRNALTMLDMGDFTGVMYALNGLWASLPGRKYIGQAQNSLDALRRIYLDAGGLLTPAPADPPPTIKGLT